MLFVASFTVQLFRLTIRGSRRFIFGPFVLRLPVLATTLLVVAIGGSLAKAATPTFAAKQDFPTGSNPRSVAAGDLNGDGNSDLAVANVFSNSVSVLLNTTARAAATSNFSARKDFAVGTDPVSVILGDLNSDGKLDLVVANNNSNNVSVLLNTTAPGAATPNFAPSQEFVTGDGPVSVAIGDLNGDGKLDLVVANLVSTVSVFLNNTVPGAANVSFAARKDFAAGDGPRSVAVGDFNLDGKPDLAVVNFNSNTVSVLLNTTNAGADVASFGAIHDFPTGVRPVSVTVGDLNGDTKPDLAVANVNSNSVSVLLNTTLPGAQTPAFADKKDFATNFNPTSVTVVDLNGDAAPELAIANANSNNISVFVNNTARAVDIPSFDNKQDFAMDGRPVSLTSSDLNNDGKLDLAVVNFDSDSVSVLLNSPTIATASGLALPRGSVASSVQIATVANSSGNGNVAVDVVSANPASGVTISNLVNSDGNITADISTSCGAVDATFTLQASEGGSTVTAILNIAVTPDNGPAVSYQNQAIPLNGSITINPTTGQADGIVFSLINQSNGFFTGNIRVDAATGVVSITNAAPAGTHEITIRASDNCGATTDATFTLTVARADQVSLITLSQANYNVNESSGLVTITINRTGDLSNPVSVNYATEDSGSLNVCDALNTGLASSRCDFGFTAGTLVFSPNETQKTFIVPITQDSYHEGPEIFTVSLSKLNGIGASLGNPSSATVTIADGLNPLPPNANDDTETFVRQQYRDFLNREADPAGLAFWTAAINDCTPKPKCTAVNRINASAAFFLSIEFQTTGNFVRNFYVAALDRPFTDNMPEFEEFERDTQALQRGVIVDPNNNAWETVLNNNRNAFMRDFVTRAEFIGMYPTTDTPTDYVDKLFRHMRILPTAEERNSAIAEFGNATTAADVGARSRVLLDATQNAVFQQREFNRSFVQMQYFGYLKRDPNDAPDNDFAGFEFWLTKLNQFNGNFQDAEMVEAFISSDEYRRRFGP